MDVIRLLLIGMLIVALPLVSAADVIPISDVNEDDVEGNPVLLNQMVMVRGVVTVETGALSDDNDIYIQDATGGVNVLQRDMASPVVALGDSVEVTGVVGATVSKRTTLFVRSSDPSTRIRVINSGNSLPDPLVLTPLDVTESGEDYEGIYALVSGVSFVEWGYQWGACGTPANDIRGKLADGDTCWIWFDGDTDFCGSEEPLEHFEVYGVIVPDISSTPAAGHGILPVSTEDVLSMGPGSGFCEVEPDWVYASTPTDLEFSLEADGGVLTQVTVEIPDGWDFSGSSADVTLSGPAFAGSGLMATSDYVILTACALTAGSTGSVTLSGVEPPAYAGSGVFVVRTADEGGDPVGIRELPEVGVGTLAAEGAVLINEIYAHSGGNDNVDRSEFIELYNPGTDSTDVVDLTGWILTDMDDSGECGGTNLWAFPEGATIDPGGYLVVAKDAKFSPYSGFMSLFGEWPDYEMYDPYGGDIDWPADQEEHPNMLLVSGDSGGSNEMRLIGGLDGSGTIVAGIPAYEAVYLYSDQSLVNLIDAVEYRDPVLLAEEPCTGTAGIGGTSDAWTPGPPPRGASLCRNDLSVDTDDCSVDFFLAEPTPGMANPASDTFAPSLSSASGAGLDFVLVKFSEPMDLSQAGDVLNYSLVDSMMEDVLIRDAMVSRDERTVILHTDRRAPGDSHELSIAGVSDASGNAMSSDSRTITVAGTAMSIEDAQAYDSNGLSLLSGDEASVVGFTTVPPGVFQPDRTNMYVQDLEGWGVNVYSGALMDAPPLEGDLVSAEGEVVDYISSSTGAGASTEIANAAITVLARGFDPLEPTVMRSGDVGHEDNEGAFVTTSGVVVSVEGFAIYIDDGSGSIQVYQNFNDLDFSIYAVGDSLQVTGPVLQYDQAIPYLEGYELAPRYESDIVMLNTHYSASAAVEVSAKVLDAGAGEAIEIAFNAPRASHVTVRIFDLKGREIATIFDGFCLGPQRAAWDARDNDGKRVPVGAYLCHVMAKDQDRGDGTSTAVPIVVGTKLD